MGGVASGPKICIVCAGMMGYVRVVIVGRWDSSHLIREYHHQAAAAANKHSISGGLTSGVVLV